MKAVRRAFSLYQSTFSRSITAAEDYWLEKATAIAWDRPITTALDSSQAPFYRWFPDGRLNMAYNCLDRHVASGLSDEWALIYDSPLTGQTIHYTYAKLLEQVKTFAGVLAYRHGVQQGDTVLIYMPMIPEAVVAMLACARLGATHSVVFGGFAAKELSSRIIDCAPKAIITANWGVEPTHVVPYKPLLDSAIDLAKQNGLPNADSIHTIVVRRRGNEEIPCVMRPHVDFEYAQETANCRPHDSVISVSSSHPLYILYTSGTSGTPKGIVHDTGGYAVALNTAFDQVYGVKTGDVMWAASDIGWVVGHTCIVYGPLLRGATTVLYEGKPTGTPDASAWWRLISKHSVNCLCTAPASVRAIKKEDPKGKLTKPFNLTSLRHFMLAGERCDSSTLQWLKGFLPKDTLLNDHWWETESGWPMIGNFAGLERFNVKMGSVTKPIPGWDIQILGENHRPVEKNNIGRVCVKLPTPPGFMTTLWKSDQTFRNKYFKDAPGYYMSGDVGYQDEEEYYHIMARVDDVIKTGGHRLSTGQLEEVISSHDSIAECAVIGIKDAIKGEIPIVLAVLKTDTTLSPEDIEEQVIAKVRNEVGPIASLKTVVILPRLPKTRSGKILRGVMKSIAENEKYTFPATIEAEETLVEVKQALEMRGYARNVNIKFEEPGKTHAK